MGKLGKLLELVRTLKKEGFTVKKLASKKSRRRIAAAKEGVARIKGRGNVHYSDVYSEMDPYEYAETRALQEVDEHQVNRLVRGSLPRRVSVPGIPHDFTREDVARSKVHQAIFEQLEEEEILRRRRDENNFNIF